MNLAPPAIEEWDNESLSVSVSQCAVYVYAQYSLFHNQSKYEGIHCAPASGELGIAP